MEKVINVVHFCFKDGLAEINRLIAYARGFAENGIKVRLFFMMPDSKKSKLLMSDSNMEVYHLWESTRSTSKGIIYLNSILKLWRMIKRNQKCFVYFNSNYVLCPLMFVNHNIIAEATEHPFYDGRKPFVKTLLFNVKKLFKRNIKQLFVISTSLKSYFENEGFERGRVNIINMFVDAKRFDGVEKQENDDNLTIVYCGSISYSKDGADILIRAFEKFSRLHNRYILKIVGPGIDSETIPRLQELCSQLGVQDKVEFTGRVPSGDMPQILKDATILALARPDNLQAQNGFPTKLGEYLATANPVVVTSVGDIPLFIHNKDNGLLAKPGDENDFAKQLCWVADNLVEAIEMGNRGKELVDKSFSSKEEVKKALKYIYG